MQQEGRLITSAGVDRVALMAVVVDWWVSGVERQHIAFQCNIFQENPSRSPFHNLRSSRRALTTSNPPRFTGQGVCTVALREFGACVCTKRIVRSVRQKKLPWVVLSSHLVYRRRRALVRLPACNFFVEIPQPSFYPYQAAFVSSEEFSSQRGGRRM